MAGKCERCGGYDYYDDDNGFRRRSDFTDYCAKCSKNLCEECMKAGCCGEVPALSGENADADAGPDAQPTKDR